LPVKTKARDFPDGFVGEVRIACNVSEDLKAFALRRGEGLGSGGDVCAVFLP
jgi:hypothetical protein